MRHVRDVIRMKSAGMPIREIARRVGAAPSTVRLTVRRFEAAGLTLMEPDGSKRQRYYPLTPASGPQLGP